MKVRVALKLITLSLFASSFCLRALAQNTVLTYQGQVLDHGTNFNGPGQFKFALVTSANPSGPYVNYWYNDGTSLSASEPSAAVGVTVSNGVFAVVLGDTTLPNMTVIPRSLFITQPNLQLRIWFNDEVSGFAALSPVQNLTPAPYAVMANSAINVVGGNISAGDVFSSGNVSLAGNLVLPDLSVGSDIIYSGTTSLMNVDTFGNLFLGYGAGNNSTHSNGDSTGIGFYALHSLTTGSQNTAVGSEALENVTTGSQNTGNGFEALYLNTTGDYNTANGTQSLYNNANGTENVANGYRALYNNLGGSYNTAYGDSALFFNTTGNYNIANGYLALQHCADGSGNTANGAYALQDCTNGNNNIALGYNAGVNLTTGNNNIDIGHPGAPGDNNTIRIGAGASSTFISGISGVTIGSGAPVYVNSSGQLGTVTSSKRFKQDIQSMGEASDLLLALRPVTFRYKPELDPKGTAQFGLIAEEVSEVDPDLVLRDNKNQIYTVRYEVVNAMLLNEFLKQHRTVQQQSLEIQKLQQRLEKLEQLISQETEGQP